MKGLTKPYILYSINTGSFRQIMKSKALPTLWNETKHFLSRYTTADVKNPVSIILKIYPIFNRKNLDPNLLEVIQGAEKPNFEAIWHVSKNDLEKAFEGLQNVQEFLPVQPNAIELKVWYNFNFRDLTNFQEFPNQEASAYLEFTFSKKHKVMPCLIFPFSDASPDFWEYFDEIRPELPFEFDEKLLRKMYVKNGTPSIVKKIARPNKLPTTRAPI